LFKSMIDDKWLIIEKSKNQNHEKPWELVNVTSGVFFLHWILKQ
jgi:hypothetical protein